MMTIEPRSSPPPPGLDRNPRFTEQVAEMRRHLEAARDAPDLERLRESAALPAAFFSRFNAALACYDRTIGVALAHDGADAKVHCKRECSNCCIDLVRGITTPEIVNIYHHVRSWPDVKELFESHRSSAEIFTRILISKVEPGAREGLAGDDPRIALAHIEYNLLNRSCAFLDRETGNCRIYAVRPVACRYFFSFDPPETCSPRHDRYLDRRIRTIPLSDEAHTLLCQIEGRLGFRLVNFLSGAFCQFTADVIGTRPIVET